MHESCHYNKPSQTIPVESYPLVVRSIGFFHPTKGRSMVLQHCKVILVPFVKTLKESSPFFITLFRNFRNIQVWIQFFHAPK